jgi:hypothetical protein
MSFLKAYHKEMDCWNFRHLPDGARGLIMAFCFCLHLRLQGTSFEKVMGERKIQPDYEI